MTAPTDTRPTLAWGDDYLLGYGPMDHTHEDFVRIVSRLQTGPDEQLPALMDEFIAHAQEHFEEENRWMRETDFPPRDCHIDEHNAVMKSVHEVRALLLDQGRVDICRDLADELARWFPPHAQHLDSALAHWMCKRATGGKPVVIRRGLQLR